MSIFNTGAAASAGTAAVANMANRAGGASSAPSSGQVAGFDQAMATVQADIVNEILNDPMEGIMEEQIIGKAQADAEEAAANTSDGLEG